MQRGRVKIRAVGPNQRMSFVIDRDSVEQFQVAQRAVEFSRKDRSKIDGLHGSVIEV